MRHHPRIHLSRSKVTSSLNKMKHYMSHRDHQRWKKQGMLAMSRREERHLTELNNDTMNSTNQSQGNIIL